MKGMHKIWSLPLVWVAVSATAAVAAPVREFFPIAPCGVVDPRDAEPLVEAVPRLLTIDADSCAVPDGATAVLVEVKATADAAARISALPGGHDPVAPTIFGVGRAHGGRATVAVPLAPDRRGALGLRVDFSGVGGEARIALDVVGYFEEAVAFSGTTGFITTRPACVPPRYTRDALNYLQGPEPIQLPNGDVTLLVGAGRCCIGTRHWEGIFSLNYPAAGRLATPRFHGLWATNDFSRLPSRKEAEVGFPSALYYGGKWRVALTTTFLPFHRPDRDRLGRLDLADLATRATPAQVKNNWIQPIDPKCRSIASCPGQGSGLDPVLTLHPNGDLYVYHKDGNHPSCASGYVRHRVATDMSVDNSKDDGCVAFEGLTAAPFLISDIARAEDGRMLLLVEKFEGRGFIAEWESVGGAAEIGLHWQPTGRLWPAPTHPSGPPWRYYVRDAAYLKDDSRTIIEPNVVVAQISDGRTYAELTDVQLGRWYLYYWADDGAVLPPTFGGPADGCAFQGVQESSDCTKVRGWAWDPMFPDTPISVDLLADGRYVETVAADQLRPDLAKSGRGDGRHGFEWAVPATLKDGRTHRITVRFGESPDLLSGKRQTITCR